MTLTFVTGGSRGLGLATAQALKAAGHQVVLFAKNQEKLSQTAATLSAPFEVVDLEDIQQTREVFQKRLRNMACQMY